MRKSSNWNPGRLWRLPAALSMVALLALPARLFLERFASGTFGRDTLAFVLAVGACCAFLGLGLGLWLGVRVRTALSFAAAALSVLTALAWWWLVFSPTLGRE